LQVKAHHRYGTGGKFATNTASVVDTGGKFAIGVNDNGSEFAADVNDTSGNLPPDTMGLGEPDHEKTLGRTSRDTIPLTYPHFLTDKESRVIFPVLATWFGVGNKGCGIARLRVFYIACFL
jgi:hypothetical protein